MVCAYNEHRASPIELQGHMICCSGWWYACCMQQRLRRRLFMLKVELAQHYVVKFAEFY